MTAHHQQLYDHRDIPDGVYYPNTQERDFTSMQLKLDALLLASEAPRGLVGLQHFSDEELKEIENALRRVRGKPDVKKVIQSLIEGDQGGA
jgi:low affinity Fe/Cu permease